MLSSALTPEHGSSRAAHVWRWGGAREVMRAGSKMILRLKLRIRQSWQSWKYYVIFKIFIQCSLKWQCSNHLQNKTLKISMQKGIQRTLCSPTLLHHCRNDLYSGLVQWTVSLGYYEPCTTLSTLCTAATEIIPPCSTTMLLITLHVSGLLCHTHTNHTVRQMNQAIISYLQTLNCIQSGEDWIMKTSNCFLFW